MKNLLIETQYLPNLEYFLNVLEHEMVFLESFETYQKQSYRNRCHILAANKVDVLSIPVINSGKNVLITDIKIDYSQRWVDVHWGAIRSAYGKSPFFEHYSDYFQDVLVKKHSFLFDLNLELLTLCLKMLGVKRTIKLTKDYEKEVKEDILDLRSKIHPKHTDNSLMIIWKPYTQIFGSNFVKNLSILDLLFCEGPNSLGILQKSKKSSFEQM